MLTLISLFVGFMSAAHAPMPVAAIPNHPQPIVVSCKLDLRGGDVFANHCDANTTHKSHCAEDDPCWNWAIMGNHKRGWVGPWGSPHIGSICRFTNALAHHKIFRYAKTQFQPGDVTALAIAAFKCN